MPDRELSKYIEGTQIIRETGLTVDYLNALSRLAINLTTWRLGQSEKIGHTEAEIKEKIIELCRKVRKYEERYADSGILDNITAGNQHLVKAIDQRVEQIREFGNRKPETLTSADQQAIDKLIDEVESIIKEGKV